jgi:hypothetical protein
MESKDISAKQGQLAKGLGQCYAMNTCVLASWSLGKPLSYVPTPTQNFNKIVYNSLVEYLKCIMLEKGGSKSKLNVSHMCVLVYTIQETLNACFQLNSQSIL